MSKYIYTGTLIWLFLLIVSFPACQEVDTTAQVIDVIDGDTILLNNGQLVRYIGIDAPEKGEFAHHNATLFNKSLVLGKKVILKKDVSNTDRYGRLLRYVYIDNMFVNAEMVITGHALAKAYPPDTKYQEYLETLESEARQKRLVIWSEYK